MLPAYFSLDFQPLADPAAIVVASHARFTVLTSRLIRLEYSPIDQFEDRASQVFWYRAQPVPDFAVERKVDRVVITTEYARLTYRITAQGFTRDTLSIEVKATGAIWKYGQKHDPKNLHGTARTLDGVNGRVDLEPGLVSRSGWAVIDDSASLLFNENYWLETRPADDNVDLYFFGYGHAYLQAVQDFYRVSGATPLIPRYILGNWWSRYWAYTQDELTDLMRDFKTHEIPLSVCIVDMDWHITETGNESTGWTGYTWNRELFPDPPGFIHDLHALGLRTALNLHPAEGVHPHEDQYAQMAAALGKDAEAQQPIEFDVADPDFIRAYFDVLHHPYEELGVDFWWLDWQQGTRSKLSGLDPLMALNHLHYYDLGRAAAKRSFIFSRWFGPGNQRYPIGFSGDSVVSWESLAFQPYFTVTASNVGYSWWSHDIGGHMQGIEDGELYARWTQFGAFSPILRLHSTNNRYQERRPWVQDAEAFIAIREAMQLRHQLIPYLYTMARCNATLGIPLITPMYYDDPENENAYRCPNEYRFGSELLVVPFTAPIDHDTRLSRQQVWLPSGEWYNFFNGDHYTGDRWITVYGTLHDIPVFARAGAIVPLTPRAGWGDTGNPVALDIHIFPQHAGRFELYEDDGETAAYQIGQYCLTTFELAMRDHGVAFTIEPGQGDVSVVPAQRAYRLVFQRVTEPEEVIVTIDDETVEARSHYDADTQNFEVEISASPIARVAVNVTCTDETWGEQTDRRERRCRAMLRALRMETDSKRWIDQYLDEIFAEPANLKEFGPAVKDAHIAALISVIECEGL